MITYESLMKAGLSETQAKRYCEELKDVLPKLRYTDETLLQKFEFYQTECGFSVEDVLFEPNLLTYDCVSDESVPTSARAKLKFLRDKFGITKNDLSKGNGRRILSLSTEYLDDKIKFLKKVADLDPEDFRQNISILSYHPASILEKVEFYKSILGYTSKQFKANPLMFTYDINTVKQKVDFLMNDIGITASNLRAIPKLLSLDCSSDESSTSSALGKLKFYKETLGFERKHIQKCPTLLQYDCTSDESVPTSIRAKIKFYKEFLGFENEDFQKSPEIFAYDCISNEPTSVKSKVKFYETQVGLNKEDIKANTVLLHLDTSSGLENPCSVTSKLKALREIGMTNEDIKNNTQLLLSPAADIKDKFVFWSTVFPDKKFLELRSWFITRLEKIYARFQYLTREYKDKNLTPNHLNVSENQFRIRFKESSENAMERYPLTDEVLQEIYENYNAMQNQPPLQRN